MLSTRTSSSGGFEDVKSSRSFIVISSNRRKSNFVTVAFTGLFRVRFHPPGRFALGVGSGLTV